MITANKCHGFVKQVGVVEHHVMRLQNQCEFLGYIHTRQILYFLPQLGRCASHSLLQLTDFRLNFIMTYGVFLDKLMLLIQLLRAAKSKPRTFCDCLTAAAHMPRITHACSPNLS